MISRKWGDGYGYQEEEKRRKKRGMGAMKKTDECWLDCPLQLV